MKISIVVPVFNAERYIRQCLESIVRQSYKDLEIIVVDDASTDATADIVNEFAKADNRILFIGKECNEGVSLTRNVALENTTGEYLMFVDGDDWIDTDTCELALKAALQNDSDLVFWPYIREMTNESRKKVLFETDMVFDQEAVRTKLYRRMVGAYGTELSHPENADALCTVWGKLYRHDLIQGNHIRFHDIREIGSYEDGLFNLEVFSHTKKALFLNQYFYHYRRNNDLSLSTAYNPMQQKQWKIMFDLIHHHLTSHNADQTFYKALSNRIVLSLLPLGINETEQTHSLRKTLQGLHQIITAQHYRDALVGFEKHYLPLHWKVFFTFAQLKCTTGVYLLLCIIQKIRGR